MLPMPSAEPFDSHDYAFEVAWQGIRALARIDRGQVRLWGRDLRDLTGRYPEVQALAAIAPGETIVDGELIVADGEGRPDSVALDKRQQAANPEAVARAVAAQPVTYVVYDLLYLAGRSMLNLSIVDATTATGLTPPGAAGGADVLALTRDSSGELRRSSWLWCVFLSSSCHVVLGV